MTKPAFTIARIKVRADGYDAGGAYWGAGPDVFIATSPDGSDQITVRAKSAKEARQKIAAEQTRAADAPPGERVPMGGASPRKTTYEFDWTNPADGSVIRIRVTHARDYLASGTDHVETQSIKPRKARLPITETGYRSHFIPPLELMNAGGPVTFVKAWLDQEAKGTSWMKAALRQAQGDLFDWAAASTEIAPPKHRPTPAAEARRSGKAVQQAGKPSRRRGPARDPG